MAEISQIFETVMMICFGASWPFNVVRSYKARTAKGKSPMFLCIVIFGYLVGIAGKFLNESFMTNIDKNWYVLFFYVLNTVMVSIDLGLYFRNRALDKKADNAK